MSHTYTYLVTHAVFSTKDRAPIISAELKPRLFAYMAGVLRSVDCTALAINGMPDHVHVLLSSPPTAALAEVMRVLKANSSKWVHDDQGKQSKFNWQTGYAAFSVSRSAVEDVVRYIESQEEHHRKFSFQEELLTLLHKHGIVYDERYVWG